jgi:GNAT superfamily N-acetyltransferase
MLSIHEDVYYNAIYEARLATYNAEERVDEIMALFAERSQLPMTWFVSEAGQPNHLSEILESKGFELAFKTPGMYLELAEFEKALQPGSPHQVIQVSNSMELAQWLEAGRDSFGLSDELLQAYFDLFESQGFGPHLPWRLLVGLVEDEPVTCARLFCHEGVAGLYHIATHPDARGHGYGSDITIAALQTAKQLGCGLAILASSPAGYNVYHRLGFRDCCYTDVYVGP